jgi:hypothetical protein
MRKTKFISYLTWITLSVRQELLSNFELRSNRKVVDDLNSMLLGLVLSVFENYKCRSVYNFLNF